ncbi:protein PSK SIMULATOR 1 isoform X1 [Lactuca sativa]|uniref:protein PSK SIMULATOR 1 isoform X1 n=1 Tax=Lactuca sativa TaxID=4236 RepID=UPI000CAED40A|nr:protein PSK SIMULATOR 1 isoform X1 [Lactuca sativa]XP_023738314.1 protein PSK SIMULATOR 1 isoform X1 [Lactuca sativa]
MGARSSKSSNTKKGSSHAHGHHSSGIQPNELKQSHFQGDKTPSRMSTHSSTLEKKQTKEPVSTPKTNVSEYSVNEDDFYDGIPRFPMTLSEKSKSRRFRVSARKAGSLGIEKAVGVLDTLGSSVTNLNSRSAFVTGPTTKGNELSILSFEVANTIMKGSSLMNFLSNQSIRHLKEVVFLSDGVQNLVSKDIDELLRTVAADKRGELKIFSGEVVRFGNRCKDPQWHNLDVYFEKQNRGLTRAKQLKGDPEVVMEQLLTLVQHTADLYRELSVLDKLEQEDQQKNLEGTNSSPVSKESFSGHELMFLKQELKDQRKQVKLLKKKSLWSRSMEDVMEKLVDTVIYLNRQIKNVFESAYDDVSLSGCPNMQHKLGPAGLALHYANIVLQIDSIVSRSTPMTSIARSTLYQSLPPDIELSFRSKLASFRVGKELDLQDIKAEMEKTLCWLSPVAINTAKAHHGFGWVGEWADTGPGGGRKPNGLNDINRIETFNHANKGQTEFYIVDMLLWLNHLINRSKITANVDEMQSNTESPKDQNQKPSQEASHVLPISSSDDLVLEQKDATIVKCIEGSE